jgi:hypothetical protein
MSSSIGPTTIRPRANAADAIDATPGSEQPNSSTGRLNTTTKAAPGECESTRKSHHSKKTKNNAISNKDIIDKLIEIVGELNDHANLLIANIFLIAMVLVGWVLLEMGYVGYKYTPTKCI